MSALANWLYGTWRWWVEFELANPLTDPYWFLEDVELLLRWLLEDTYDFLFPFTWFRVCGCIFLLYLAKRILFEVAPTVLKLRRSYLEFLALGRGERASNVLGWIKHQFLKFIVSHVLRLDPLSKPYINPYEEPYNGQLLDLPQRERPRPNILGLGPLKQEDGGHPQAAAFFEQGLQDLARRSLDRLQYGPGSRTGLPTLSLNLPEQPALWGELTINARMLPTLNLPQLAALRRIVTTYTGMAPELTLPHELSIPVPHLPARLRRWWATIDTRREWQGEVAHIRPDGSLHVHLHPHDAASVVRCGWGQRNPLAVMHEVSLFRFFYHWVLWTSTPMPSSSVIVYAPSEMAERDVVVRIIEAGKWWAELNLRAM